MDMTEFVNAVAPTVAGPCVIARCDDLADHICDDSAARCLADCICAELAAEDATEGDAYW
jgi:hypothetical protein